MIKFDKPNQFNGVQLCDELEAEGIEINRRTSPCVEGNGDLFLDIDAKDAGKAQRVLDAHIAKPISEPTVEEKLVSVGLNIDDLKAALGL